MTWQEVIEDKCLKKRAYRIELNQWGKIVMTPMGAHHCGLMNKVETELRRMTPDNIVLTSCAIQTSDNVKVADVVWLSPDRHMRVKNDDVYNVAPEICIEIKSPDNTMDEMIFKKELYLERGAVEFWLCDDNGVLTFFGTTGKLAKSQLVPKFPAKIEV